MNKLTTFTFVSLDGYFAGPGGDISWHPHGADQNAYAAEMLVTGSTLVFGRVTYELMASYWPTPQARTGDPVVAEGMNTAAKIVFSRTLKKAEWTNTTVCSDDAVQEMAKLKRTPGADMTVLGSGSIVKQFAEHGLIDEVQIMVDPVVLGEGATLFRGARSRLNLKLVKTRAFESGAVLLTYRPA